MFPWFCPFYRFIVVPNMCMALGPFGEVRAHPAPLRMCTPSAPVKRKVVAAALNTGWRQPMRRRPTNPLLSARAAEFIIIDHSSGQAFPKVAYQSLKSVSASDTVENWSGRSVSVVHGVSPIIGMSPSRYNRTWQSARQSFFGNISNQRSGNPTNHVRAVASAQLITLSLRPWEQPISSSYFMYKHIQSPFTNDSISSLPTNFTHHLQHFCSMYGSVPQHPSILPLIGWSFLYLPGWTAGSQLRRHNREIFPFRHLFLHINAFGLAATWIHQTAIAFVNLVLRAGFTKRSMDNWHQ